MRKSAILTVMLVAGISAFGANVALGCGDKFVLIAGGARINRSKYPSHVLVFMNPNSRVPAAEKEFHLEATLAAAGHKATVVETQAEVDKAIASGKYDLVLADTADAPELRRQCGASASKPAVLPLLYKPTADELAAAQKEASCLARPSKKSSDLLAVIDETMKDRSKGVVPNCSTAQ
ncbi:MAG TPA: hypothetical protein VGH97_00910 [Thermoanaerobaculia bacterium]|jgi:hypothetical protein